MISYSIDFPVELIHDVNQQLGAFAYDWHTELPGLRAATPQQRKIAEFLVGGMVFGGYAQATGTDHLIQPKRSDLLLAVSAPPAKDSAWRQGQEEKLFSDFKLYCANKDINVRATDFRAPPTVLPYLLLQEPAPARPMDLLERCLTLRENRLGQDYRNWYEQLRKSWSLGRDDPDAEKSIQDVLDSLHDRMGSKVAPKDEEVGGVTLSIGVQGLLPTASLE